MFNAPEYKHKWYFKNKERILQYQKDYRKNNLEKIHAYDKKRGQRPPSPEWRKKWNLENKEKMRIWRKAYRIRNAEHIKEYSFNYRKRNLELTRIKTKNRLRNDPYFKLKKILRVRLYHALRGNFKNGSAVKDLGCTISKLKIHIEQQFKDGMSWENWSVKTWHIDHKIPLDSFDLTKREQLLKACHYSNLQPMWALENYRKGTKVLSETHILNQL